MKELDKDILNEIDRYVNKLKEYINIYEVIIYGSQINGRVLPWSDIDIAIISNDFDNMSVHERVLAINKPLFDVKSKRIRPYAISTNKLKNPIGFINVILKTGLVIYGGEANGINL